MAPLATHLPYPSGVAHCHIFACQAVEALRSCLAEQRGHLEGLPPLTRAALAADAVAPALDQLLRVFEPALSAAAESSGGCNSPPDLALEPGLCPAYDAAREAMASAEQECGELLEAARAALAAAGRGARKALLRVKLVELGGETLLQVPAECAAHAPATWQPVRGCAKTLARFRLPTLRALQARTACARAAARGHLLAHLRDSARLFLDSYPAFQRLCGCMALLDVLAGFAACTHPASAPPGLRFCRPVFLAPAHIAAAAADASSRGQQPAAALDLQGLWSPQLLASRCPNAIVANDLRLGGRGRAGGGGDGERWTAAARLEGDEPCPSLLLLTGPNTGEWTGQGG